MTLVDKKRRQPRKQEIRKIIEGEESAKGAPREPLLENFQYPRSLRCGAYIQPRPLRHPLCPRQQPEQADQAQCDEERPPPIPPYKHCAEKYPERRAARDTRGNEGIGAPAQRLRKMLGEYFAIRRESYGFSRSQD